jgi:hypothetical protein
MTSIDDRFETAGAEVRNAFDRGRPMTVDVSRPQRRAAGFVLAFVLMALVIALPALLLGGGAPPVATGTSAGPAPEAPVESSTTSTTSATTTSQISEPASAVPYDSTSAPELVAAIVRLVGDAGTPVEMAGDPIIEWAFVNFETDGGDTITVSAQALTSVPAPGSHIGADWPRESVDGTDVAYAPTEEIDRYQAAWVIGLTHQVGVWVSAAPLSELQIDFDDAGTLVGELAVRIARGLADPSAVDVIGCSSEPPFDVELPDDFAGPVSGMSPQSDESLEPGQSAVHWTGRGGSLELRWPIGRELRLNADDYSAAVGVLFVHRLDGVPEVWSDNPYWLAAEFEESPEIDDDCEVAQLSLFSAPGERSDALGTVGDPTDDSQILRLAPGLPRAGFDQLIAQRLEVDDVPGVIGCTGNSDPATLSEAVAEPTPYPTAAAALEAFVETRPTWPKLGYVEFVEPDGSITYGSIFEPDIMAEPDPDNGLVIAVSVTEVDGGWAVVGWASSSC